MSPVDWFPERVISGSYHLLILSTVTSLPGCEINNCAELLTVDHGADSVEILSPPELIAGLGRKVKCTAFAHIEYKMLMWSGVSNGAEGS